MSWKKSGAILACSAVIPLRGGTAVGGAHTVGVLVGVSTERASDAGSVNPFANVTVIRTTTLHTCPWIFSTLSQSLSSIDILDFTTLHTLTSVRVTLLTGGVTGHTHGVADTRIIPVGSAWAVRDAFRSVTTGVSGE